MKRLVLLSLFLFIFSAPAYAESGLVAYYDFDEGNGTVLHDRSGNGNNGTIYGAAWTNGINGSALGFDGAGDYVRIPGSNLSPPIMTLEMWIKTNSTARPINVLNKAPCAGRTTQFGYKIEFGDASKIQAYIYKEGGGGWDFVNVLTPVETEKWYHLVFVSNYTELSLYSNGVLINNALFNSNIRSTTQDIFLGGDPTGYCGPRNYKGLIDELKIYKRALSAEEIKAEYEKYTKPAEPLDSDNDGLPDSEEISHGLNPHSNDTDSDGINDLTEYKLLTEYMPVFQYTEETRTTDFYPQPVSIFMNYSNLYEFPTPNPVHVGSIGEEELANYSRRYYLDFKGEEKYGLQVDRYLLAYLNISPQYGYVLYMRAVPGSHDGSKYIVLQYWHHYLYNDFNFFLNRHEGDWEMVEVLLNGTTLDPIYAAYSQHIDSFYRNGGEIRNWADVQRNGTHSFVYVARGSHASYFEDGNHSLINRIKFMGDYTSSGGPSFGAGDFNQTIILRDDPNPDTQRWLLYGGRWGTRELHFRGSEAVYADGPVGPRFQGIKWDDPVWWAIRYPTRQMIKEYVVLRIEFAELNVRNLYGAITGIDNGTYVNDIPDAEFLSLDENMSIILPLKANAGSKNTIMSMTTATAQQDASYTYIIEPKGTYNFEIYLVNETEARHIVFYNVSGTGGTKDNIWVKGDKIYMNTTGREKRLNIMLEYMNDTFETRSNLTGITFLGKETLVIKIKDWTDLGRECKKGHDKEIRAEKQKKCKEIVKIKRRKSQGMRPTRDSEDEGDTQEGEE